MAEDEPAAAWQPVAKAYQLLPDGTWVDLGLGTVVWDAAARVLSVSAPEAAAAAAAGSGDGDGTAGGDGAAAAAAGSNVLLAVRVRAGDRYKQHNSTIVMWEDTTTGDEYAISFRFDGDAARAWYVMVDTRVGGWPSRCRLCVQHTRSLAHSHPPNPQEPTDGSVGGGVWCTA